MFYSITIGLINNALILSSVLKSLEIPYNARLRDFFFLNKKFYLQNLAYLDIELKNKFAYRNNTLMFL